MTDKRQSIVTFKADESILRALDGVENRSAFIRAAILSALDNLCPVCQGTGLLTPNQRRHWEELAASHAVEECDDCHERRLICHANDV